METMSEMGSVTSEMTVGQKQEENDNNENTAFEQRLFHITDRAFNETTLAENIRRHLYICRQILLQIF